MSTLESAPHGSPASADARRGSRPRPGARSAGGTVRAVAVAAFGPLVTSYAVVAALLALVIAVAPGASFDTVGVLVAAGPAWLAVYHVPVDLGAHQLGALPLLPTLLAMAMVARAAANAARRLELTTPRSAVPVICAVGGAHAAFAALLAIAAAPASSPVVAFFAAGAFATLAAVAGVAREAGLLPAALARADAATVRGLRAGALGAVGLVGAGALVLALGLVTSWPSALGQFRHGAPGFGAGLGMVLLCVGYLPNAVVGALSFAAGPGATLGAADLVQWRFHAGPMPGLPLLAAVPTESARWWVLLCALPAAVGALVGLHCRALPDALGPRLRAVLVAALVAGGSWLVLAGLAGGTLGGGRFGEFTVPAGLVGAAAFGWIGVVGALVTVLGRWSPAAALLPRPPAAEPTDEPAEDPAEEPGDDASASEGPVGAPDGP